MVIWWGLRLLKTFQWFLVELALIGDGPIQAIFWLLRNLYFLDHYFGFFGR